MAKIVVVDATGKLNCTNATSIHCFIPPSLTKLPIMSDIVKAASFIEVAYKSFCKAVSDEGVMTVEGRRLRYVAMYLKYVCVLAIIPSS